MIARRHEQKPNRTWSDASSRHCVERNVDTHSGRYMKGVLEVDWRYTAAATTAGLVSYQVEWVRLTAFR